MSQAWTEDGRRLPVTIVQAGPVVVTQIKNQEKDGYIAVQLGLGERKIKNTTKPLQGHFKKSQIFQFPRFLKEVKISPTSTEDRLPNTGEIIKAADIFAPGDLVKATGISKGKGFAGVVKRWHFAGGPRTHGQSDRERAPGSIGQTTTPGRVYKGKKMAGRMGGERSTARNLIVLSVKDDGEVKLSGPIPGNKKGLVLLEKIGQSKKFSPLVKRGEEIHPEESSPIEADEEASERVEEQESKKEDKN